jgi:hypothetical protein
MPIFISYNHKDIEFVNNLVSDLLINRHNVWLDRWEMNVGDSLIDRIQSALIASSAVLVIISKNSIASNWCKKELNSTLMREIEEKKSLLLPCVIDDCEIPLFLREKLYADFKRDSDQAFSDILRALAKISSLEQGRSESPNFYTDWSYDWYKYSDDNRWVVDWTFVDHGHGIPYVVLSSIRFHCDYLSSQRLDSQFRSNSHAEAVIELCEAFLARIEKLGTHSILLTSAKAVNTTVEFQTEKREKITASISCRRMGDDTGMDTICSIDSPIQKAIETLIQRTAKGVR